MAFIISFIVSLLLWLGFQNWFAIEPNLEGMFYDDIFMLD